MARRILPGRGSYKAVFEILRFKQRGSCLICKCMIKYGQVIVSNGKKNSKYYHEDCARKVLIIG